MSRVAILDSALLDQDLVSLLLNPVTQSLSLINSSIHSTLVPELTLLIQATIYKLSVWDSAASYGAKLQGLHYASPRFPSQIPKSLIFIHSVLTILLPYFHTRARTHALSRAWPDTPLHDHRRKAWELLTKAESLIGVLHLFNFVAFLRNGRFRSLADRLLGFALVPSSKLVTHDVSYEFMNRQMVWQAFTEFLLFALPLVRNKNLKRRLSKALTQIVPFSPSLLSFPFITQPPSSSYSERSAKGPYWSLPLDQCAICAENAASPPPSEVPASSESPPIAEEEEEEPRFSINLPYVASCGHKYCYHCLTDRILRTSEVDTASYWACLRCGAQVTSGSRSNALAPSGSDSDFDFTSNDSDMDDFSASIGTYSESAASEEP